MDTNHVASSTFKELGMQSELVLHRNNVHQSVELLLLVPMLFLLAIPKIKMSSNFKENFITVITVIAYYIYTNYSKQSR